MQKIVYDIWILLNNWAILQRKGMYDRDFMKPKFCCEKYVTTEDYIAV